MMNSIGSRESLNAKIVDELMAQTEHKEYYDRRQNGIKDVIQTAKTSLENAISNLDLNDDSNHNLERSYLDCAIHISFMILELQLYENIIEGKDVRVSPEIAKQIQEGNWTKFVGKGFNSYDKKIPGSFDQKAHGALEYMGMIKDLERLQNNYENKDYLTTQEFAN